MAVIPGARFRGGQSAGADGADNGAGTGYGPYLNAGAPVNGTTFDEIAEKGALLIDTTNGILYINTGTKSSSVWTKVGTQT